MNKEKISQFHRDNILSAADALFLQRGVEKTTIETIAKEAGYSKPTLYAYFQSKEEIYAFNLYRHMLNFKARLESRLTENEAVLDSYLACCHETARLQRDYPVYFYGMMGNLNYRGGNLSKELIGKILSLSKEINGKMCGLFSKAAAAGTIDSQTDVNFAYVYVWSCILGIVTSPKLASADCPDEKTRDEFLDRCFLNVINVFQTR